MIRAPGHQTIRVSTLLLSLTLDGSAFAVALEQRRSSGGSPNWQSAKAPRAVSGCDHLARVDVSGGEIVQALVIAAVIVMLDKVGNGPFEVAGQIVVFKQDATLQREMPSLDLALGSSDDRAFHGCDTCPVPRANRTDRWRRRMDRYRRAGVAAGQDSVCSSPDACKASSSVAVTSAALIVVQSFQATM